MLQSGTGVSISVDSIIKAKASEMGSEPLRYLPFVYSNYAVGSFLPLNTSTSLQTIPEYITLYPIIQQCHCL